MPEQPTPLENAEVRYEASDARIAPMVIMGIGIILLGLLAHGICLWMFDALRSRTSRNDPELPALAAKERLKLPQDMDKMPAPQLQVDESKDLATLRAREDEILNGYGWIDPKSAKVRIPIEEAMRMLANPDFAKTHGIQVAPAKDQLGGGKR